MITTEAMNQSVDCSNEAAGLAAWLANHGGAIAIGTGVTCTHTTPVFTFNCSMHSKSDTITFTATDYCGYTDSTTAVFTVTDNTPPTAAAIPDLNFTCNANIPAPDLNLVTGVSDNCDGSPHRGAFCQLPITAVQVVPTVR